MATKPRIVKTYKGISKGEKGSFEKAAEDAWEQYKKDRRPREAVELRVVDMYVVGVNPIRDYIVVLGTTG